MLINVPQCPAVKENLIIIKLMWISNVDFVIPNQCFQAKRTMHWKIKNKNFISIKTSILLVKNFISTSISNFRLIEIELVFYVASCASFTKYFFFGKFFIFNFIEKQLALLWVCKRNEEAKKLMVLPCTLPMRKENCPKNEKKWKSF